jgi:hypothetical protein
MKNLAIAVKGTTVTMTFDIGPSAIQAADLSSTGKTRLLAGTGGAFLVDNPLVPGLKVAVNVMIPR